MIRQADLSTGEVIDNIELAFKADEFTERMSEPSLSKSEIDQVPE